MKTKSVKTAGYSNATLHAKRGVKRNEAQDRQAIRDDMTNDEKIASLRIRRGDSVRQLLRLQGKG